MVTQRIALRHHQGASSSNPAAIRAYRTTHSSVALRESVSLVAAYPGLATASPEDRVKRDETESGDLAELLSAARDAHPSVAVRTEVIEGAPDGPLVRASENAALLVLGAQRTHPHLAPPLGRVVRRVLHQADCPVALVPPA
jgi:nucleotide-binding universal stress UspA family protein